MRPRIYYSMAEEINNNLFDQKDLSLESKIEALLFVAPVAVNTNQIAEALKINSRQVEKSLKVLEDYYKTRGIRIQRHKGLIQLTSAPEISSLIEHFLSLEASTKLSRAALETLSIIAYQQPVTRPEIDSIRGVNSDSVIKNMLNKGLIDEAGRSESAGRPILYTTSTEFLQHFGLNTIKELPPLQLPESPNADEDKTTNAKQSEFPLDNTLLKE